MKTRSLITTILGAICLNGCTQIPIEANAIKPFDVNRYLGQWYEIARFDFRFERNMSNVTATYTLRPDGLIKVDNRGYNYVKSKWQEAIGKAKFANSKNKAMLKVSFFGPFYGGYNVIAPDPDYKYALVAGSNTNYLWILSREKILPESIKQEYLKKARDLGFDVDKLIWTKQESN